MTPTSTLRERVLLGIAAQPSRTRSQGRVRKVVLFAMAALASTGPPLLGSELDVDGLSVAAGSLLVALACTATSKSPLGPSPAMLVAIAVLAPIARWLWLLAWPGDSLEPNDAICFARTIASTAPIFLAMFYVRARTVIDHPRAHGAAIGTTAAAFGAVIVDVFCARSPPTHVFVGHVLPLLVFAGLGAIGGEWLAMRPLAYE